MDVVPRVVRRIEAVALDIALRTPFGIAGGVQDLARNVLITIELDDGTRGLGEAAPLPAYNGETQARALAVLQSAGSWLSGRTASLARWRDLSGEFRMRGGGLCGSAQAGFEMALLDALTRGAGMGLETFFGGAGALLETDMTVTTGSVEEARSATRDIVGSRGIRTVKVKVGGQAGPAHDLARLGAIWEEAPGAPLIIDGNAGLTRAQAGELVRGMKARGIVPVVLEQWLAKEDLPGMRALGEESGWRVAADEAACSAADVRRIGAGRAAQIINVKLMKAGVAEALDVVQAARAEGLGLMIGGNVESILAMTVSACFASGLGGFEFADLDTPLFLAENPFAGGMTYAGGRLSLAAVRAGHGVSVRSATC